MSASNSWAEFAGVFRDTRQAFVEHQRSKAKLKALMPEDAKEAIGHEMQNALQDSMMLSMHCSGETLRARLQLRNTSGIINAVQ